MEIYSLVLFFLGQQEGDGSFLCDDFMTLVSK